MPAKKKIDDEALADEATEQVADESLADVTPDADPEPEAGLEPEDFDLVDWLNGLGHVTARYPLPSSGWLPLRARTVDWHRQWIAEAEELSDEDKSLHYLAAHVADERVTLEHLTKLRDVYPVDFDNARGLAWMIDHEPASQIPAPFLPAASD